MRSYNRFETDQEVQVTVDKRTDYVRLYNLSSGGCMIESEDSELEQGSAITLRLAPKTEVPGRVVWRIGKNAGIKFGTPVHHRLVARYGFPPADEFDRNDPRDRFGLPISG
ncbi:MAG: PilZ domain-containing protein [Altererythrobacter sp.]